LFILATGATMASFVDEHSSRKLGVETLVEDGVLEEWGSPGFSEGRGRVISHGPLVPCRRAHKEKSAAHRHIEPCKDSRPRRSMQESCVKDQ
jgi:hypothetical protein